VFHETPTGLFFYTLLLRLNPVFLEIFFILCDVITALALTKASELFFQSLVLHLEIIYPANVLTILIFQLETQQGRKSGYHKDAKKIMLKKEEVKEIPQYVTSAYILNPYTVFSCVAMTTTVFANVILALTLLAIASKRRLLSTLLVSIACHQSFYPLMLLVPVAIATNRQQMAKSALATVLQFVFFSAILLMTSYQSTGSWRFIDSTYGCMLVNLFIHL
jgi:phosphatidylinositol glycan class U